MVAVSGNAKKVLTWVAIALVLFFVLGQPQQAAEIVRSGVGLLEEGANRAITFMQSLFAGVGGQ